MSNPIEQFDITYKGLTYAQRQNHLRSLISSHEQSVKQTQFDLLARIIKVDACKRKVEGVFELIYQNSPYLDLIYKEYLRRYPFNSYYWNRYAQHVKNTTQSAEESEKIYQYAIQMNPRSYDLWHCYISSVKSDKNDAAEDEKVIKLIEQALQYIGYDYNSSIYWEDLIGFYSENKEELIKLYRRALSIVTKNFDDIYEKYNAFFSFCSPDQIKACYNAILGAPPADGQSDDSMILQIKTNISNYSERTKAISHEVQAFESKLTKTEYEGDSNTELNVWIQYINFAKTKLAPEQVIFLYEKALISQCDKESLWVDFFAYLESQNQHSMALQICRKQEGFLKYINNNNLLLQWAELEELYQAYEQAREIYKLVVSHEGENYLKYVTRWAQFEKRANSQVEKITEIYEKILSIPNQKADVQQWAINELCKVLAGSERKQALVRYIHFFESQPINKVNYAQLLQFVSQYFSQEPNFIETLSEVYINAITASKKNQSEVKNIVNMSISHLRTISYNINEIRITEQKIKAAENQQGQANGESLLKKRSIVELVGEESINGYDSVQKHIKTN